MTWNVLKWSEPKKKNKCCWNYAHIQSRRCVWVNRMIVYLSHFSRKTHTDSIQIHWPYLQPKNVYQELWNSRLSVSVCHCVWKRIKKKNILCEMRVAWLLWGVVWQPCVVVVVAYTALIHMHHCQFPGFISTNIFSNMLPPATKHQQNCKEKS